MNPAPERKVRVAAVANVHSPKYLREFRKALSKCDKPDFILLAGDMIHSGTHQKYMSITEVIDSEVVMTRFRLYGVEPSAVSGRTALLYPRLSKLQ